MRVYYKPFVPWIWAGVLLMVLGGALAAVDRRYRAASARTEPMPAGVAPQVGA
jgi:cytochrome c-type biogenesis protein CcmF